jgi:hypothetical protein
MATVTFPSGDTILPFHSSSSRDPTHGFQNRSQLISSNPPFQCCFFLLQRLAVVSFQQSFIVCSRSVERSQRVMPCDPVLNGKDRRETTDIFQEKRVMTDTEPQEDIEVRFRSIEELCLSNGVAHGLKLPNSNLLLFLHSDSFFRGPSDLTCGANNLKSVPFQNSRKKKSLIRKSSTKSDPKLLISHSPGKFDELLQASFGGSQHEGMGIAFCIAEALLYRGNSRKFLNRRFIVLCETPFEKSPHILCRAPRRPFTLLEFAEFLGTLALSAVGPNFLLHS